MCPDLSRTLEWLNGIGLRCHIKVKAHGFFPGVRIVNGGLHVTESAHISDVLHEAGHLAILPGRLRHLTGKNVDDGIAKMMPLIDFSDPESGEARAIVQAGDSEATAWAWAAGLHLRIQVETIIRGADYQGNGANERLRLSFCDHIGIHGLSAAGFCVVKRGPLEAIRGLPAYPKMAKWVQPGAPA